MIGSRASRKKRGREETRVPKQESEKTVSTPGHRRPPRTAHAPETGLGGLCLASDAARVLLARLVEPSLDTRLPVLAEVVAVEDAVGGVLR